MKPHLIDTELKLLFHLDRRDLTLLVVGLQPTLTRAGRLMSPRRAPNHWTSNASDRTDLTHCLPTALRQYSLWSKILCIQRERESSRLNHMLTMWAENPI